MRSFLVLVIALTTSCYEPAIDLCQVRCDPQDRCPEGLVCNLEKLCAAEMKQNCGQIGDPTPVTITVLDELGGPAPDATVVFADARGAEVAVVTTDADGRATAVMEPGGSATVMRVVTRDSTKHAQVTTYLDLWRDADIISQHEQTLPDWSFNLTMELPTGLTHYRIHTSCDLRITEGDAPNDGEVMVTVPVRGRCKDPDVVIIASDIARLAAPPRAAVLPAFGASTAIFGAADFMPLTRHAVTLNDLPGGGVSGDAVASGWITRPRFEGSALASAAVEAGGDTPGWDLPHGFGATAQLRLTNPLVGEKAQQTVYERLDPGFDAYTASLVGRLLPWSDQLAPDLAARHLRWAARAADATTAAPSIVIAALEYQRGDLPVSWRILGLGTQIDDAPAARSFPLPDVPGDRAFELTADTTLVSASVTQILVAPALVDAYRAHAGEAGHEPFDDPTLRQLSALTLDYAPSIPMPPLRP